VSPSVPRRNRPEGLVHSNDVTLIIIKIVHGGDSVGARLGYVHQDLLLQVFVDDFLFPPIELLLALFKSHILILLLKLTLLPLGQYAGGDGRDYLTVAEEVRGRVFVARNVNLWFWVGGVEILDGTVLALIEPFDPGRDPITNSVAVAGVLVGVRLFLSEHEVPGAHKAVRHVRRAPHQSIIPVAAFLAGVRLLAHDLVVPIPSHSVGVLFFLFNLSTFVLFIV